METNKTSLKNASIRLQESGLSKVSVNNYIRGINVFLGWLQENEHTTERLVVKQVKQDKKVLKTFNESHLKAIISWKPKGFYEWRMYALLMLLLDTGIRIDEALTLKRSKVNLDDLVISVIGKGNKERIIPISNEYRKILYRFLQKHSHEIVFCTFQGSKLMYRNMLRDFKLLGERLELQGVRISFHTLRHTFAYNYVREGGDLFRLQKILGHTDLAMTRRYVELQPEDLRDFHKKSSILGRLK